MNGRIYDPTLGRMLQADPFIQAPTNTQSYNRYSYVWNNPMSYTDPSGYFTSSLRRGLIKAATKVFGKDVVNIVGSTVSAVYGGGWGAAAWTYEYNRAMGVPPSGSLRAAFVAGVNTWANGPQSINASSALQAMDVIDPETAKYLNFAMNGVNPDDWAGTAMSAMHEVKNHYAQEEMARFAKRNGMTLGELNALLTLNSFAGREIAGSRLHKDGDHYEITGFTTRSGGLISNDTVAGLVGVIWDINDTLLGYQGLLDAVGHEFIQNGNGKLGSFHSLGTLTCNNLVARGYADSATLNSLPFGNVSVGPNALTTNLGAKDFVNGFIFGRIFNPISNTTKCVTGDALCHGQTNYEPNGH